MSKLKFGYYFILVAAIAISIQSCKPIEKSNTLVIAVSKERRTEANRYASWLEYQKIAMRTIDLSMVNPEAISDSLALCHALLLTGGADIFPGHYGKESDTARCGIFDRERDHYEMIAYHKAKELGMPILGICRGLQLINVAEGGTLFIDLPFYFNTGETHRVGKEDWATHSVSIVETSKLDGLTSAKNVNVASNHHQGIEILGSSLQAAAYSPDRLIEAIEWNGLTTHPFLLGVQWHPEWMDRNDTLSGKIAKIFLEEAARYRSKQ